MPRYFHLHTEARENTDLIGMEFRSLEAAVAEARIVRTEYIRDEGIEEGIPQRRCRFEITDEHTRLVATVPAPDN
jgi:hypothetical protein